MCPLRPSFRVIEERPGGAVLRRAGPRAHPLGSIVTACSRSQPVAARHAHAPTVLASYGEPVGSAVTVTVVGTLTVTVAGTRTGTVTGTLTVTVAGTRTGTVTGTLTGTVTGTRAVTVTSGGVIVTVSGGGAAAVAHSVTGAGARAGCGTTCLTRRVIYLVTVDARGLTVFTRLTT